MGDLLASLVGFRIKGNLPMVDRKEGGILAAIERGSVAGTGLELEVEHWWWVVRFFSQTERRWVFILICFRNIFFSVPKNIRRAYLRGKIPKSIQTTR